MNATALAVVESAVQKSITQANLHFKLENFTPIDPLNGAQNPTFLFTAIVSVHEEFFITHNHTTLESTFVDVEGFDFYNVHAVDAATLSNPTIELDNQLWFFLYGTFGLNPSEGPENWNPAD
jgi:hypothetical protein